MTPTQADRDAAVELLGRLRDLRDRLRDHGRGYFDGRDVDAVDDAIFELERVAAVAASTDGWLPITEAPRNKRCIGLFYNPLAPNQPNLTGVGRVGDDGVFRNHLGAWTIELVHMLPPLPKRR